MVPRLKNIEIVKLLVLVFFHFGRVKGTNFLVLRKEEKQGNISVGVMKTFGSWILLLVTLIAFMCFAFYIEGSITSSNPGLVLEQRGSYVTLTMKSRKLKEEYAASTGKDETDHVVLEDYRPIDPVPSSKASVRPGPIQHGTPLMPYIPKPSPPPVHPENLGLP